MIEADRFIAPQQTREEELLDRAIRPKLLADYQGQDHVRSQMEIFIEAARRRNEALDCRAYAWAAMKGLVQEFRLSVQNLHAIKQLALFKGDPLTSGHAVPDEVPEPIMSESEPKSGRTPRANKPVTQRKPILSNGRGRRVVKSGYISR